MFSDVFVASCFRNDGFGKNFENLQNWKFSKIVNFRNFSMYSFLKCIPYSGLDINDNGLMSLCNSDSDFSKAGFGNFLIFNLVRMSYFWNYRVFLVVYLESLCLFIFKYTITTIYSCNDFLIRTVVFSGIKYCLFLHNQYLEKLANSLFVLFFKLLC